MPFSRTAALVLFGLIAALAPLQADWKITIVTTLPGYRSVETEYFKPGLWRHESETSGPSTRRLVVIVDKNKRSQTIWDLDRREYVVMYPHPVPPQAAIAPKPVTAPVIRIDIATRDTGERQTFFGRTARHLITSEKRYRESVVESESSTDAWYIDVPNLPPQSTAVGYILAAGNPQPIIKVNHTGAPLTGLAVQKKITTRNFLRPGRTDVSEETVKVTGLSEANLSPQLFEPPKNFRRVTRFPDEPSPNWLEMYWQSFEDWLNSLFS